jgi:hypothetical protein
VRCAIDLRERLRLAQAADELIGLTTHGDFERLEIDVSVREFERPHARGCRRTSPAVKRQQVPHAAQELIQVERLGQVLICPDIESACAIGARRNDVIPESRVF